MTTPGQEASKGKVAAFVLFGVAAVAAVMGIVSVSGGGQAQNAAQASSSQHPGTPTQGGSSEPQPSPSPTSRSQVPPQPPPSSQGAGGETTKVVPAPVPGQQPPQPAGQQVGDKSSPVRVYNNGTIKHLATQAADRLRGDGFNVVQVANYPNGVIPTTTVYYQGSADQPTAESLASDIGAKAQPRFPGIADASPGVIVIVTNDYKN